MVKEAFQGSPLRLKPVMFSMGVNEQQTVASWMGDISLEGKINAHGAKTLQDYNTKLNEFESIDRVRLDVPTTAIKLPRPWYQLPHQTVNRREKTFQLIKEHVSKGSAKDVSLLVLADDYTRLVGGSTWISCKSAKDRTSMLCTLNAASALVKRVSTIESSKGSISKHKTEDQKSSVHSEHVVAVANVLRSGVRFENCELNTGRRQYAFNRFQLGFLPKELRPPAELIGANDA